MKTKMEDIDKLIKETLTEEEAKFYEELDEQDIFDMVVGVFKGKNKWMFVMINIIQILTFIAFVYCVVQFFNVTETNDLIKWGLAGFLAIFATTMLKMFTWMQMDRNAIVREIKRLEIQLSSLAAKNN